MEPSYYFEMFGPPREGDLMGRVEARPRAQMYAVERTVRPGWAFLRSSRVAPSCKILFHGDIKGKEDFVRPKVSLVF